MTQPFTVELFHGLFEAGQRHTLTVVRDPTGHDEVLLAELASHARPAEHASSLIAALMLRIGDIDPPGRERLLELTAGDRERLILAICARLHGPQVDLVAACASCGTLAEIPVRFDDVTSVPADCPLMDERDVELEADDGRWIARCRPPTGADLEKAAEGGTEAARGLLVDCLLELVNPAGFRRPADELPEGCASRLSQALADFDPAAERIVEIDCPSCAGKITALLDGLTILRTALGGAPRVLRGCLSHGPRLSLERGRDPGAAASPPQALPGDRRRRRDASMSTFAERLVARSAGSPAALGIAVLTPRPVSRYEGVQAIDGEAGPLEAPAGEVPPILPSSLRDEGRSPLEDARPAREPSSDVTLPGPGYQAEEITERRQPDIIPRPHVRADATAQERPPSDVPGRRDVRHEQRAPRPRETRIDRTEFSVPLPAHRNVPTSDHRFADGRNEAPRITPPPPLLPQPSDAPARYRSVPRDSPTPGPTARADTGIEVMETPQPVISIGRIEVQFLPQPQPIFAPRAEPQRTRGFDAYARARRGEPR